jgi:hypothetical protein
MLPNLSYLDIASIQTKPFNRRYDIPYEEKQIDAPKRKIDSVSVPILEPTRYGLGPDKSGITVVPLLDSEQRTNIRKSLATDFNNFPEFATKEQRLEYIKYAEESLQRARDTTVTKVTKSDEPVTCNYDKQFVDDGDSTFENDNFVVVGGGYQFLANPSSFHCKTVRTLRRLAQIGVLSNKVNDSTPFHELLEDNTKNLEQIADRLMVRRLNKSISDGETWHRDVAQFADDDDRVFGGWINLDLNECQYFSCVPDTAYENIPENAKAFWNIPREKWGYCESNKVRVEIPPGHMLIFDERTIHEVLKTEKKKGTSCRLFTGWRVTRKTESIVQNLEERLRVLEALPIKSGQHAHPNPPKDWKQVVKYPGPPPMWPPLWFSCNPHLLFYLSSHYSPNLHKNERYSGEGPLAQSFPEGLDIIPKFMPPLIGSIIDNYTEDMPKYDQQDIEILMPRREWSITDLESKTTTYTVESGADAHMKEQPQYGGSGWTNLCQNDDVMFHPQLIESEEAQSLYDLYHNDLEDEIDEVKKRLVEKIDASLTPLELVSGEAFIIRPAGDGVGWHQDEYTSHEHYTLIVFLQQVTQDQMTKFMIRNRLPSGEGEAVVQNPNEQRTWTRVWPEDENMLNCLHPPACLSGGCAVMFRGWVVHAVDPNDAIRWVIQVHKKNKGVEGKDISRSALVTPKASDPVGVNPRRSRGRETYRSS